MKTIIKRLAILILFAPALAAAKPLEVTWGGYVDTYFAYSLNTPAEGDRVFFTQPARANEFNLNLGYIDVNISSDKIRGRFALQAGNSVQSNYAPEPVRGEVSGPELARHIQEARLGYKLNDKTWIDAGIFFSHVGAESWISQRNPTLTRSFLAEYSPYYLSGVKLTHRLNDRLKLRLLVTNGWQKMAENNTDKNIGTAIEYSFDRVNVSYSTMSGQEVSPELNGNPRLSEFRHFHNLIVKSHNTKFFEWILQFDTGFQDKPDESGQSQWYGASLMGRLLIAEGKTLALRLEHFKDEDQIVFVTDQVDGLNAFGASIGFDQTLEQSDTHHLQWRTELRYIKADANVFPKNSAEITDTNITATTSMALSF